MRTASVISVCLLFVVFFSSSLVSLKGIPHGTSRAKNGLRG